MRCNAARKPMQARPMQAGISQTNALKDTMKSDVGVDAQHSRESRHGNSKESCQRCQREGRKTDVEPDYIGMGFPDGPQKSRRVENGIETPTTLDLKPGGSFLRRHFIGKNNQFRT